jgi:biopolymer transport protein ExbB/TolQ
MFISADIVVQSVMVGLVFASLVTRTVWLAKNVELWLATRRLCRALAALGAAGTLADGYAELGAGRGIAPALAWAARLELRIPPTCWTRLASRSGSARDWPDSMDTLAEVLRLVSRDLDRGETHLELARAAE